MKRLLENYATIEEHVSLKKYNTYRVEGKARYLVSPNSITDLGHVLKILKDNNTKFFILGNGSNIVLNDREYDGVVIKLDKLNGIDVNAETEVAYAEAGAMLPKLAQESIDKGLTGLEFAISIPGTIGGSIYGNAGAYNSCILDYVESVTVMDENYDVRVLEHEEITYSYRHSMFKEQKNLIILGAKFQLKEGDKQNSLDIIEDRRQRRVATQPLEYPSAGSVFRNPDGDFAGRLIEFCQLKGYTIGGAQVSEKHANFIINIGNATGEDVYKLIKYVHDTVLEKTNIDLIIEQEFIDWE